MNMRISIPSSCYNVSLGVYSESSEVPSKSARRHKIVSQQGVDLRIIGAFYEAENMSCIQQLATACIGPTTVGMPAMFKILEKPVAPELDMKAK
jgi:hypothetical protein